MEGTLLCFHPGSLESYAEVLASIIVNEHAIHPREGNPARLRTELNRVRRLKVKSNQQSN